MDYERLKYLGLTAGIVAGLFWAGSGLSRIISDATPNITSVHLLEPVEGPRTLTVRYSNRPDLRLIEKVNGDFERMTSEESAEDFILNNPASNYRPSNNPFGF